MGNKAHHQGKFRSRGHERAAVGGRTTMQSILMKRKQHKHPKTGTTDPTGTTEPNGATGSNGKSRDAQKGISRFPTQVDASHRSIVQRMMGISLQICIRAEQAY